MSLRTHLAILFALLAPACASPPTRFYELAAVAPATSPAARSACPRAPFTVQHVVLPETLDRLSLVREAGPGRLDISGQHRWAAPLDGMVQGVLAEDLRQRLPTGSVVMPGDPAPPGAAELAVTVERFMPEASGGVVLDADWTLRDGGGHPRPTRAQSVTVAAAPTPADAVAGMSRALGELADQIAGVLRSCAAVNRSPAGVVAGAL